MAESGDRILVERGVYIRGFDLQGKDLWIESLEGPQVTVIDLAHLPGIQIGPSGALVGFTITNGRDAFGAGLNIRRSETIVRGNIFEWNEQTQGGAGAAILGNVASPIIEGNIFRNNTCDNQFTSGVVSFFNRSSPVIINNLFNGNDCRGVNMTLPEGSSPKVINNTFVGNRVAIRFDRRISVVAQSYQNNIAVDNEIGLEVDFGCDEKMITWEHNLLANVVDYDGINDQTGRNGNIRKDPLFLDPSTNDFRLKAHSPAIDAGDNTDMPIGVTTDFDGNPRFLDDPATPDTGNGTSPIVDMGAYEFIPTCGNGVVDPSEQCDDSGESTTCDTDCTLAECGDGTLNVTADEECDDGGESSTCDIDCTLAECGDGTLNVTAGEECDDGLNNSDIEPNMCRTMCVLPSCSDNVIDIGEECDDGLGNSDTEPDACRTDCVAASCGDGVTDIDEECDDGNLDDGDLCSGRCIIEGACCDRHDGLCRSFVIKEDCIGRQPVWTQSVTCRAVICDSATGSCCNTRIGTCTNNLTYAECQGEYSNWTKGENCSAENCPDPFIPIINEWGMVIMTLLILIVAKLYFGIRRTYD